MAMVLFLTLELIDDSQIIQIGVVWRRKFQERNNFYVSIKPSTGNMKHSVD